MTEHAADQKEPPAPPDYVAINPVRTERAADFEEWLRSVVVPAVEAHRPHTVDRWQVLRAREADGDTVVYAFLFYGETEDDWELEPLLTDALGSEEAQRQLRVLESMYKGDQNSWAFDSVVL